MIKKPDTDKGNKSLTVIDNVIPIAKIIELRKKNLTYDEIGKILDCTRQNIEQRLHGYKQSIDSLKSVKDHRADTLAVVGDTILNSLTAGDIKKSTGYQKVGMYSLLYDKERLERGQSTENIGYYDYTKGLDKVIEERDRLQLELGMTPQEIDADVVDVGTDEGWGTLYVVVMDSLLMEPSV